MVFEIQRLIFGINRSRAFQLVCVYDSENKICVMRGMCTQFYMCVYIRSQKLKARLTYIYIYTYSVYVCTVVMCLRGVKCLPAQA